ncbi:MAG: formimidoylglutamate deiminase [Pseudomonadota bacterium]|nr:formimidoylglutamate deiminase [Pseudomonadota bacterium]
METLWFETALLPGGWSSSVRISHADGRIVGVEAAPLQPGDERGAIALPGLCNVHSHAFQRGMGGLAETRGPTGDDFWTWRTVMYRFVDRLNPDDLRVIAALAYAEMLESGFTRVGEFHYLHHDLDGRPYADPAEMVLAIASAACAAGIGLTLLPVFYAQSGFGGVAPTAGQRRFVNSPDSFARLLEESRRAVRALPDALVGVAPHSLRAVTPRQLALIAPMAGGAPIHIHIAEQSREVEDCLAWCGQRPVEWLFDHAPVDASWCLVHATHMTDAESDALAASGAVAGLCPITEANLGDGLFPGPRYLAAGGAFGIGSDSNVLIDVAEELRMLEYGQRLTRQERNVLTSDTRPSVGGALFFGAHAGGARALGVEPFGLEPGAPADLVCLDARHPSLAGRHGDALLDAWIFAARGGAVESVWRHGRKMVEGGRHIDRDVIAEAYRRTLSRLLSA